MHDMGWGQGADQLFLLTSEATVAYYSIYKYADAIQKCAERKVLYSQPVYDQTQDKRPPFLICSGCNLSITRRADCIYTTTLTYLGICYTSSNNMRVGHN